ncbi:MAG: ATP-binding protein [Saprospiraceae bacterium]
MNELEFNTDNTKIGFRLHSVELLNWGTFHNKIWRIEPNGNNSLLTGDVGSGKSTLVDALTCLIVPHHKITFNKAAGAESKERTLASYIRGEYKNTKSDDADSREKAVSLRYNQDGESSFSVIIANFSNEGYHESVSLAQVFWLEHDKPQKLLIIREREPLSVKTHFSSIEDAKELRKRMKDLPGTEVFDDNFSKYSQRFRQLFGMQTDKAIDLFYQTVSMKSVSSLTLFVREQMLERTEIKTQIEDLKKRFDDLNKAYEAVQQARKQKETLEPLADFCKRFAAHEERLQDIDRMVAAVPAYFASKKITLLEDEIAASERKQLQLEGQMRAIEDSLGTKREQRYQIAQDIRTNGGERLENISKEIAARENLREAKKKKYQEYSDLTAWCGLETAGTDKTFFRNLKNAEQKLESFQERQQEMLAENGKIAGRKSAIEENIEIEAKELESLKQREHQIPLAFLDIRTQIANALDIRETEIPFAGELMQVNDREKDWEGALERLLGGFGVSMLVPEKYYRQISAYINQRKLTDARKRGLRFEYFKVPATLKYQKFTDLDPDSVVHKIEIKSDSPFEPWLEAELQKRFNLRCVALEEFQRMPGDVITREGQYKTGNQRHIKDDRRDLLDKRNFVLGWSNLEKIRAVEHHLAQLRSENEAVEYALRQFKSELSNNTTAQNKLSQLIAFKDWNTLNWKDEVDAIVELQKERETLQNSNDLLKTLEEKYAAVNADIAALDEQLRAKVGDERSLSDHIRKCKDDISECTATISDLPDEIKTAFYPKIEQEIKAVDYTVKSIDRIKELVIRELHEERKRVSGWQNSVRDKIIQKMKEYKDKFPSDALDLSNEIEARGEYLNKLEKIVHEGLPAHEATLKTMLNKNTIDDIVAFDNKLDIHEKEIRTKIRNINAHLKEIEFNKGTYIELIADRNRDYDIRTFKEELKACYSNILDTNDAYTEDRFRDVQKILNRFRSNENKDIEWTNKVTDVRNWFDFNASERYFADHTEKEFYAGSSGKSGGQKEKLAYTIIASALAYQFGLKIGEPKSKSFRFAVIDEAFGKGSDASAEYGLELFKKLNLQLLIVTPLQKIHIIENYINAVHYVSNIEGNNSAIHNMTVEAYKAAKQLHQIAMQGIPSTEILK